jgi:hypothetical protein
MTTRARVQSRKTQLSHFVDAYPLGMVAAAFGVGYALSGALFSKTSARILGLGLRYGAAAFLRSALSGNPLFTQTDLN